MPQVIQPRAGMRWLRWNELSPEIFKKKSDKGLDMSRRARGGGCLVAKPCPALLQPHGL